MRRREFITLVGGAAATWPLVARAQQAERMRRIGVLMTTAAADPEGQARIAAFRQGLQKLGWTETQNVRNRHPLGGRRCRSRSQICKGIGRADAGRYPSDGKFDCGGVASERAPSQSCSHTPSIRWVLVSSKVWREPAGNITGFVLFEYGISAKWLELLKEIAPSVTRVAVLRDPAMAAGTGQFGALQSVAPSFGVELSPGQRARSRRDRAYGLCLCAFIEWRPNRGSEPIGPTPSQSDRRCWPLGTSYVRFTICVCTSLLAA